MKKIQSLYQENIKHSENISKFSRRTLNSFLNNPQTTTNFYTTQKTLRIKKNKKKPFVANTEPKTEKTENIENIENSAKTIENPDAKINNKENEQTAQNIPLKDQVIENSNGNPTLVSGTIEESKTLEENLKKNNHDFDNKQSGLIISENIEAGKKTENETLEGLKNNIGSINIEKSVNLE